MTTPTPKAWPVEALLYTLGNDDPADLKALTQVYGANDEIIRARVKVIRQALATYSDHFGSGLVWIVRAPGRVNLRGMHVDTHGGYLNLMSHHREVVVVAGARDDRQCNFVNTDPAHAPLALDLQALDQEPEFQGPWMEFILSDSAARLRQAATPGWMPYVLGSCYRIRKDAFPESLWGINAVVASDLPEGSGLSSSAALCSALQLALATRNGMNFDVEDHIRMARDGEWFTGARTGLADQSALWLGKPGQLHQLAIQGDKIRSGLVAKARWPNALALLVIQSFTQRNLSGTQLLDYTRNRFAYSMALPVLTRVLRDHFGPTGAQVNHLCVWPAVMQGSDLSPYEVLRHIPESISIADLRSHYDIHDLDEAYTRYFGQVPSADRPTTVPLRGPLLFGLAESERARIFLPALKAGNFEALAGLMNRGHDGDRLFDAQGMAFQQYADDESLARWCEEDQPFTACPGIYRASSAILDALVDTALEAGAMGACLTGAGIAGSIIALCKHEQIPAITQAVEGLLQSPRYATLTGHDLPSLVPGTAVVVNHATAGVCPLHFDAL